ncbi:MAG: hypothetical protein QOI89_47 [Solirubrobacteraceae bacterium]|jgi:hypothetical protein|nr:hypothetical protein [Solirubrobacteraceae bacterium]
MLVVQARLAQSLGLAEDASETAIRAALDQSGTEEAAWARAFPELEQRAPAHVEASMADDEPRGEDLLRAIERGTLRGGLGYA